VNDGCAEQCHSFLEGFCNAYVEEEGHGPHHLQILTEDDDNQVAVYLFDDHFRALAPGLTDFLLLDGWELPGTWSDTRLPWLPRSARLAHSSAAEGAVYAVRLFTDCRSTLEDLDGGVQVQGIRVPDRCRYLLTHSDEEDLDYGLQFIRGPLQDLLAAPVGEDAGFLAEIRDNPGEEVHWNVYSDWLEERGQPPAGLYLLEVALRAEKFAGALENRSPALDRVKVTPHMAQACKHEGRWAHDSFRGPSPRESDTQWIFFDDRWLSAHPTLATGILQVAAHWDVLSTRPREGGDILS
jgi:uncharacterized protein (TIGR02996 family)